ncbi:hypothetical protein KC19_9G012200 [Ceratodon purpureus]|uniref:Uncharacterized protein n=1 Tax=Ceratodon purpureus TaxID=3225 RepID=A0A8T0GPC0_CERPU|nr:hypothetical protein KC19_9G012200 [Ceratodon purpureus]
MATLSWQHRTGSTPSFTAVNIYIYISHCVCYIDCSPPYNKSQTASFQTRQVSHDARFR